MFLRPKLLLPALVISALHLSSCATLDTRLPKITAQELEAETRLQQKLALTQFKTNLSKVMDVAWPVLSKNADLCQKTRPAIGVKTHDLRAYRKKTRKAAAEFLAAKEKPSLLYIIPNSPADKAGLLPGDKLLDLQGNIVRETDKKFWSQLQNAAPRTIKILRNEKEQSVEISAQEICHYNVRLRASSVINAYADGRNITITSAMVGFTRNKDELALIIGHELAHNTMGHIHKVIRNRILTGNAKRYTRPFESEAHYVGLYYQTRAGFTPDKVEEFWRRLSKRNPKYVTVEKSHPAFPDRFLRLKAGREEIQAKQKSGAPLRPNARRAKDKAVRKIGSK